MAEYNPFKKEFWTMDNLSNKEARIHNRKKLDEKFAAREQKAQEMPDWKTCPKCHGTNVKLIKRTTMMFYFWAGGILMLLVGIILWPLLIPGVLAIFASPLFLFMPRQKKCRDCTHTYY